MRWIAGATIAAASLILAAPVATVAHPQGVGGYSAYGYDHHHHDFDDGYCGHFDHFGHDHWDGYHSHSDHSDHDGDHHDH